MRFTFANAAAIPAGFWKWPNISAAKEWACSCCGEIVVETDFLDLLQKLRTMHGRPLIFSSGYRCPKHNAAISETGPGGPHTTARAADITIYGTHAYELVGLAFGLGFSGIGLSQKGEQGKRFVHLDDLRAPAWPRPWIWTY